jgi:hypothetical protein
MPDSPRMVFENQGGMSTVQAPDLLKPGQYCYLQNTRKLLGGRIVARPPLGSNLIPTALPASVTSVTRMSDPYAPSPGYVFISGAAGTMYVGSAPRLPGLSGAPLSFLPYRPPASPQPWCYIGDAIGMFKVRSDGIFWPMGIMEPQVAPGVTSPGNGPNPVVYRYTYRSSITGAVSNPSPESFPVLNGGGNSVPQAGVAANNPTQYTNYTNSSTGGTMNNEWTSQWGSYNAFETIDSWGNPARLMQPIQTQNMSDSGDGTQAYPVPAGATITGIQFQLNWFNQSGGAPGTLVNCQLSYQGQLIGTQKQPNLTSTEINPGSTFGAGTLIAGDGDTWGASLNPAIVNDPTFGVNFQILEGAYNGTSHRLFIAVVYVVVYWSVANSVLQATAGNDAQADVIDYYRMGGALENFTYVGTGPTGFPPPPFTDTLSDSAAELNPILQFDNYQPFPSIDLPRQGVCNVGPAGAITWVSGDQFNERWLPGTLVLIGGVAYVLYNRPQGPHAMRVYTSIAADGTITYGYPPPGINISYAIAEPTLAAQPSPVIWGPTPDNAGAFAFGLDPNNPGDLVWTKGNNFDSAPDTNRMAVTSPSEPLMNGTITSEVSTVFSTDRFWLIYPNFFDAVATVTGTLGQQWTLVQAAATRGLYMRYAIAALANLIAWRAKDGIFLSQGGGPEKNLSESIYNLFPHGELEAPQPVVVGSTVVYPPDDTNPNAQIITLVPGYLFYDYQDVNGNPRTLVYDMEAKGWSVDVTSPVANCHSSPVADNQILVGCVDGTIRAFDTNGSEAGIAVVATPSVNGGSARKIKRVGAIFLRAQATVAIAMAFWKNRYLAQVIGVSPSSVGPRPVEADYFAEFTNVADSDVLDLAGVFSFPLGTDTWLKEWQTDWTEIPEQIAAWRTGMLSYGLKGWMHAPWIRFAYQSAAPVVLTLLTDQLQTITINVPASPTEPGKFFAWLPPNKFKLMEWTADGEGDPFTVYGADCEIAVGQWGRPGPYSILRPIRQADGSTT